MSDYPDPARYHRIEHDRWMIDPCDVDFLPPAERWCRVCTKPDGDPVHARYVCARCDYATAALTPLSGTLGKHGYTIPTCPRCKAGLLSRDGDEVRQPCRGCGVLFPYSPDADFCDECAAENAGDTREGCYRVYYRTDDGREGFFAVEAVDESDAREHAARLLRSGYDNGKVTHARFMRAAVLLGCAASRRGKEQQ